MPVFPPPPPHFRSSTVGILSTHPTRPPTEGQTPCSQPACHSVASPAQAGGPLRLAERMGGDVPQPPLSASHQLTDSEISVGLLEHSYKLQQLNSAIDTMWVLTACFFVFSMQVGFAFLEAGSVRAVNVITITFKNLGDCSVGALLWFVLGSQLADVPKEGQALYGFMGAFTFAEPAVQASNLLMFMYLATATTIVSGAVAERITIIAYYAVTAMISAFHYPIVVHWMWADDWNGNQGWLRSLGAIDFAGSLVVHMNSGVVAFWAAYIIGPRKLPGNVSPFSQEGKNITTPHNKFLQAAGVMFLWVGWIGFNAGSVSSFTKQLETAERAAVSTVLAGSTGAFCGMAGTRLIYKHLDLSQMCNCLLGSLVAITASCAFVSPSVAVLIGFLSSLAYFGSHWVMQRLEVDDVVDAASVHGVCGMVGTLAVIMGEEELMGKATRNHDFVLHRGEQLGKQLIAIVAVATWSTFWTVLLCSTLKKIGIFRVDAEHEVAGCDGRFFRCYGYDYIGDVMREITTQEAGTISDSLNDDADCEMQGDRIQLLGVEVNASAGDDEQRNKFKFLDMGTLLAQFSKVDPVAAFEAKANKRRGYASVADPPEGDSEQFGAGGGVAGGHGAGGVAGVAGSTTRGGSLSSSPPVSRTNSRLPAGSASGSTSTGPHPAAAAAVTAAQAPTLFGTSSTFVQHRERPPSPRRPSRSAWDGEHAAAAAAASVTPQAMWARPEDDDTTIAGTLMEDDPCDLDLEGWRPCPAREPQGSAGAPSSPSAPVPEYREAAALPSPTVLRMDGSGHSPELGEPAVSWSIPGSTCVVYSDEQVKSVLERCRDSTSMAGGADADETSELRRPASAGALSSAATTITKDSICSAPAPGGWHMRHLPGRPKTLLPKQGFVDPVPPAVAQGRDVQPPSPPPPPPQQADPVVVAVGAAAPLAEMPVPVTQGSTSRCDACGTNAWVSVRTRMRGTKRLTTLECTGCSERKSLCMEVRAWL